MLALRTAGNKPKATLPKVLIASHERSGAQFLLDSLACNFGYSQFPSGHSDSFRETEQSPPNSDITLAHLPGRWSSGLLKSHYEFGFYKDWLRRYAGELHIIYVVRDVLPVLCSYQRHLWQLDHFEGPRVTESSQFIRTAPAGAMLRFQHERAETMVHRWANHVRGWLEGAGEQRRQCFTVIQYDSLNEDFASTMRNTASFLGLPAPTCPTRPNKLTCTSSGHGRWAPTEFRLSDHDLEFINGVTLATQSLLNHWNKVVPRS